MSLLAADLEKLSVADLKKRLFWAGASLPDGHLEKADIISVVKKAEAEKAEKAAEADQKRVEEERGVPKPDPKPLDFNNIQCPDEEKQIVELHLLTEKQLRDRIEQAGHDVPKGEPSKHYLVALCRKAMKDPREPKPKKAEAPEDEEEEAVVPNRRPTIGDRVQIRDTMIMKRYLPEAIGKVFRIFKDDGGAFPYRLAGVGEQRHWFSEDDICWPVKKAQKTFITPKERTKAKPDNQPEKVVINHNRYGCTAGEVRDVLGETADKRNWVLSGGRQVPKMHEGSGWSRKVENSNTICDARPPPPPPGSIPRAPAPVTLSEEEMFAQMEEMQAQMDAEEAQAAQAPQEPLPAAAPEAQPVEPVTAPTPAAAPPSPAKPSPQKAQDPVQKDEASDQAATEPSVNGASDASVMDPGEERRKRKADARAKAQAEGAARRLARRQRKEQTAQTAAKLTVSDDEVEEVQAAADAPISIDDCQKRKKKKEKKRSKQKAAQRAVAAKAVAARPTERMARERCQSDRSEAVGADLFGGPSEIMQSRVRSAKEFPGALCTECRHPLAAAGPEAAVIEFRRPWLLEPCRIHAQIRCLASAGLLTTSPLGQALPTGSRSKTDPMQGTSTQGVLRSLARQENAAHVVREPRLPNARSLAAARQMAVSAALRTVRRAVRDAADEAVSGPPRRRQATRQDRPRPTEGCRISPLFEAVVAALPAAEPPTRHDIPKGERCAVCHGKLLRRGRKIRHLPCGHIFHDDCILPWLQKRTVCPLCRRDFSTMVQESKQRRDASWVATMLSRENQPNEEEAAAESLQPHGDLPILLD
ncbi:E3 ubiquitin-protein ligase [Symbiodinium microadriaticum]|uniref:E3 ubiquitin-protein ligase n=1 Tax=Symbiodinium microadriaticum TaxID=2951 RepID=A0A1Q9EQR6_SYMMI|nr:E3 ubiquitin-protein ligase [Symbiodinium microadriaticum]CAE7870650.1 rnf126 [Symbiodinium microadriaticum]CAE7919286.1 rnf126 [Symbiodinium sp. KB8]